MLTCRPSKKLIGKRCLFHGFDGVCREASIVNVRRGIVVLDYPVRNELVRAYVERSEHRRIERIA